MRTRQGLKRVRDKEADPQEPLHEEDEPAGSASSPRSGDTLRSKAVDAKASALKSPKKSARNAAKNAKAVSGEPETALALEAASDDEGPEEVPLTVAKSQAEDEAARRKSETQRPKRPRKRLREDAATGEENAAEEAEGPAQKRNARAQPVQEPVDDDVLPQEVLEALKKRRQQAPVSSAAAVEAKIGKPAQQAFVEEQAETERQVGPVTVALLNPKPSYAPSVAAKEYASQRLYGSRHKRSQEMLTPVGGSHKRGPVWKSKGFNSHVLRHTDLQGHGKKKGLSVF